jgi:serine/threonine-protein kinase
MTEVAEGTLVDGRYRIKHRLGSGGMADVYAADDSQLGREVALKVLHRRFARDREFVERFRREASSAASLQHPNVVSIYDRGEYDGTYYIAMEHLPGRTLKDIIREEAPLPQERAIAYAIQILQAASFAHRRGVVHRDFKPHNVIVGPDGRLKVTDFGIARAGASEMTETGSIMGTAQYLSPEQAQGQRVGTASDLYSIGIVLYEMLTGRVPFTGESAVSIALKHVSEQPPRLRELRPDVHPRLEQAVGRALLKDPEQRYANADEFIAALETARSAIRSGENGSGGTATWVPVPPTHDDDDDRSFSGRRWPFVLLALLLLGVALAAVLVQPWKVDKLIVPTVTGQSQKHATETLTQAGFKVQTRPAESDEKKGRVIAQDPAGGDRADKGSTIELVVSSGPGQTLVPSVSGLPQDQAIQELNGQGFEQVTTDPIASDTVPKGFAVKTSPAEGTVVPKGSKIRLFLSSGPPKVQVPDVVGQNKDDARASLKDAGFKVTAQLQDSDQPKGNVLSQDPVGGTSVDKGSTVTIQVSKGPQKVDVPDVVGQNKDDARTTLGGAGFKVKLIKKPSATDPVNTVIKQSPSGGSQAVKGSTVTIYVAVPPNGNGGTAPDQGGGPGATPAPVPTPGAAP